MTDLLRLLPSGKKQKLILLYENNKEGNISLQNKSQKKHKTHNTFLAMISKMTMPFIYVCHFKIVKPNPTQFLG